MAVRGAVRCDILTSLPEAEVVKIFDETLGKHRWAKELFGNPSRWKIVSPPPDAATAAEWVRNKREERVHATKPGGFQDTTTAMHIGTVIALGFNASGNGRTAAHLFTSLIKKTEKGKVNPVAVMTVRNQMKRVASAVKQRDPEAQVSHYEDAE